MPEHFELEPDSLRNVADQHDRKASDLRAWGAVPDTWLAEFEQGYGTIAEPVRVALMHHYNQRKAATDDLAAIHEDTRDKLTLSAAVIESADTTLGQLIFAAYWFGSAEPALTTMVRPQTSDAASSRSTTMPNVATSHGHAMTDSHSNGSTAAPLPGQRDSAKDLDIGRAASDQSPPVAAHRAPAAADGFAVSASQGHIVSTPTSGIHYRDATVPLRDIPAELPTGPLTASGRITGSRLAAQALAVGRTTDDDMALARTLLSAILAAVRETAPSLEWAVSVLRAPAGPIVSLTSTEGRGWLPPGLYLPEEVLVPWPWDATLGPAARAATLNMEGTSDPARMLAEFARVVRNRNMRLSALASSAEIGHMLRDDLGSDVAVEDRVQPKITDIDLSAPGSGLADRLALAGSANSRLLAETASLSEFRRRCLQPVVRLFAERRPAVSGAVPAPDKNMLRVLAALQSGLPVPPPWLHDLHRDYEGAAADARRARLDVSDTAMGHSRRDTDGTAPVRGIVMRRRMTEMLLLLSGTRLEKQELRDAAYVHGQIVEHPIRTHRRTAAEPGVTTAIGTEQRISA